MCPAHRLDVLREVQSILALSKGQRVVCVSTQLIEAGVNIDFGAVIRYLAGLDSITQAAGRCNRNGLREEPGNVWIVNPESESIDALVDIVEGKGVAERVLRDFNDDPALFDNDLLGPAAMSTYYQYYFFRRKAVMNYPVGAKSPLGQEDNLFNVLSINTIARDAYIRINRTSLNYGFQQSFQSAAKAFRAIDAPTRGVIVPYGDTGKQIINDVCAAFEIETQFRLLKKAQRYSVNLLPHEFKKMAELGAIHEVQEGAGVFYMDGQYYDDRFGWSDEIVKPMETLIVSDKEPQ
jgi:CRISPR-associated endonuclease/helicase Cas3